MNPYATTQGAYAAYQSTSDTEVKGLDLSVNESIQDQEFAVQIISKHEKETEDGVVTELVLHEEELKTILARCAKISPKIAVVAVVGAYRTGKSFILDLLLRYLRYHDDVASGRRPAFDPASSPTATAAAAAGNPLPAWIAAAGDTLEAFTPPETDPEAVARSAANSETAALKAPNGFAWRPDQQRTTTGIWMYGRPFKRKLASGEEVAVLMMDTQGMFDMMSTQQGTATVFALSTLISSYEVYNIQNRLGEDNLQHLNFFH
jgi:atlastin